MTRPSAKKLGGDEVGVILDGLTPEQLQTALLYISGYSPEAFDAAFAHLDRISALRGLPPASEVCGARSEPMDPGSPHDTRYMCSEKPHGGGEHVARTHGCEVYRWPSSAEDLYWDATGTPASLAAPESATSPEPLPAGHGENHHGPAGNAVHVTHGVRVAGCVTCEAGQ